MTDQSQASSYCSNVNFKWNEMQTAILLADIVMPAEHEVSVSVTTGPLAELSQIGNIFNFLQYR